MTIRRIITEPKAFSVQPENIDPSAHLFEAFGNHETKNSAAWIVKYLQERGEGWAPFSQEEIDKYYSKKYKDGFRFNHLVDPELVPPSLAQVLSNHLGPEIPVGNSLVVLCDDGKYRVTDEFIARCFQSSPAYIVVGKT